MPQPNVIVVLSGRMPERAADAGAIYRQGYTCELWVTHSADATEDLRTLGIDYVGESFYGQKVLIPVSERP